jgi:hypothetical protein
MVFPEMRQRERENGDGEQHADERNNPYGGKLSSGDGRVIPS